MFSVCVSPTPPSHGSVESDGLLANYSCDNGYSLSGASIRICDSNGVWWNGAAPTCSKCAFVVLQIRRVFVD